MIESHLQTTSGTPHRVVLSGCSSAGKSSILEALERRGHAVRPEAGRQIVREQLAMGGDALPWADAGAFVEHAVARAIRQFEAVATGESHVVFDRSVVDLVSFLDYKQLPVPAHLGRVLRNHRYSEIVLIAPPWRAIYVDDGERRKHFEQAVGEYEALMRRYRSEGYRLCEIPRGSVDERADFCERHLRSLAP